MFVYCKSWISDDQMLGRLRALDAVLTGQGWQAATLWRRPASPDAALRTWMSVYPPVPPERAEALAAAIARAADAVDLTALLEGGLHIERFSPCA